MISKIPYFFTPPAPDDVIAFLQPGYGLLIKRIHEVLPDRNLNVIGSHPESIDSRNFGPVNQKNVIGKVIWHIHKT